MACHHCGSGWTRPAPPPAACRDDEPSPTCDSKSRILRMRPTARRCIVADADNRAGRKAGAPMDTARFDRFTVTFARRGTRRAALALLSAIGLSALLVEEARAACASNGTRCGRPTDLACCSGRCVRKQGTHKKFCRPVRGQGTCTVEHNNCGTGGTDCNSNPNCACYVTTRGWSVCGDGSQLSCATCEQDTDCKGVTGKGSRCVPCPGTCGSGTLCVHPCPPA
jgi:hypothetical protein